MHAVRSICVAGLVARAAAQCPQSCAKDCQPPRCGPACCKYHSRHARKSSRGRGKPCRLALPHQLADDAIQPLTFALVDVLARDDGSSPKRATVRKFTTMPADQHHVEPLLRALRTSALRRSAVQEAQLVIADVDVLLHMNKHGVPDIDP